MPLDTKHHDLQSLRIDRSAKSSEGEPAPWAKRYIIIGISIVVLLSLSALMYRLLAADAPEVEVARAAAENSDLGGIVLSATGYIVAHHKINVNSKVTGRVKWIGVEKGDKVKKARFWSVLKTMSSARNTSRRTVRLRTHAPITRSCSTAPVPKKFSKRSTILPRPGPHWPTTRLFWIALAT